MLIILCRVKSDEEKTRASIWIPEIPDRITSIFQQLKEDGLVDRCRRLEARNATRQELLWLHDPKYLNKMEATPNLDQSALIPLENESLMISGLGNQT